MLPPKKSTTKKPSPAKKYKKTSSGDSLAEDIFEFVDPTGISSYDDVYRSYKKNGLLSLDTGLEILGALPIIGKGGKILKGLNTTSKLLNKVNKVNKVVSKTDKVIPKVLSLGTEVSKDIAKYSKGGKANPIGITAKVVGKGGENLIKVEKAISKTTGKVVDKTVKLAPKKEEAIKTAFATLNTANTTSSALQFIPEEETTPQVKETVKPKVVYYNTNSKHGKVETPGNEEGVQYVPVSNSVQLEKWKNQKLAYGTNSQGIMKKKMNPVKRYANGTNAKGMDPNHYIISPAEALNDYNIMLAKAEAKANSNPWLPIVAGIGKAMQTGIGIAGKAAMGKAGAGGGEGLGEINENIDVDAINKFNFSSNDASLNTGVTAAMGMNNVQQDVEVEGGEMFETPQGQVGEFKGPSHEQGGIPLEVGQDVEEGTKVYSDRLKIGKKTLAERKATRERQIANLEKIASDNLADEAVKNAAKRKMMAIQKEEAADLQFQDQVNNLQAMADTMVQTFACGTGMGGVQKMDKGGVVGDPPAYGKGSDGQYYTADTFKLPFNYWLAKLQETEGDKYRVRSLDNVDDRKEFQRFFYKDDQGKDLSGQKIPYTDKDTGKTFMQDYTIDGILGQTAMAQSHWGVGTDYANYMDADGNLLPNTQEAIKNKIPVTLANNPNINFDALKNFGPPEGINDNASTSYANPSLIDGVPLETIMTPVSAYGQGVGTEDTSATKKEPSKLMKTLADNIPAVGDVTKLIGNYLGMTAGIKTAAEQRSTDVTHRNVFANAGKESQRLLDNAKQGIETNKAQAIVKATTVGRGGKKGARGSARGVNTMRGMDWLYDTALQQQIAEISANAANQIAGIDTQKSSVAMSADQLKGQGEYQAAMANEAAKDAYYTALGLGRKDFATGLQQTGKDLNDMKQNKIIESLMKNYGTYFIGDKSGVKAKTYEEITGGKDKKDSTTSEKLEVKIDTEGNEYIIVGGKKQLIKRK